jgi:flagellar assembly factor FliW
MTHALVDAPARRIHLRSRFADVEVDPRDIITFPDGIPGYEGQREFVLLNSTDFAPLTVLHAVDAAEPCFLAVDPKSVLDSYRCDLGATDRLRLGAAEDTALLWLAIVSVNENGEVAANLRAPIVVNPQRMVGRQVMPNNCVYPLHHVLVQADRE